MNLQAIFKKYNRTDLFAAQVGELKSETWRNYMQLWLSWFRGNAKKFHHYTVYNGKKKVKCSRRSAGMAKTACEDWASLLMNEKTDVKLSDEKANKLVKDVFAVSHFWVKANDGVEKSFALGLGAFIVRIDNIEVEEGGKLHTEKGKVKIEFVSGNRCYPLTVDDERVTECAFVTKRRGKVYISLHLLNDDETYRIENLVATEQGNGDLVIDENMSYTFNTGTTIPFFACLKPNTANSLDIDSPLGVSIYANAIDNLETIDLIFDSFGNEYNLGKKRVYASAEALNFDDEGNETPTFDPNDVLFYQLPKNSSFGQAADGRPYVQESTGELRAQALIDGMNHALNLFSQKVGLGENRYRFDMNGIATATQVISENSSMFRNVRKHEILVEELLIHIVNAVVYASNAFTPNKCSDKYEVEVSFDDSIIEDKASERQRDREDVTQGLMAKWEYRVKWYGETEEEAKKWEAEQRANAPKLEDTFGSMFGSAITPPSGGGNVPGAGGGDDAGGGGK